jgi:SAM-dependent methyltransferase
MTDGSTDELVTAFRDSVARLPAERRFLADWLPQVAARTPATAVHRPFTDSGRTYRGYAETLANTLRWYKPHKMEKFELPGWTLDPSVVERVRTAARDVIDAAAREAIGETREYLRSYDPSILARYTAIDIRFEQLTGQKIGSVLDFGSGIGRQAWYWGREDVRFYSVDASESLYLLQHASYRELYGDRLVEWLIQPRTDLAPGELGHLPAWALEAIPGGSIDLILAVQVLQEISPQTLSSTLETFRRIIRPGGLLYIRDKEAWQPEHHIRVGRELLRRGWRLLFRYTGREVEEIEGVPRLWVYTGSDNSAEFSLRRRVKRLLLPFWPMNYGGWQDIGLPL